MIKLSIQNKPSYWVRFECPSCRKEYSCGPYTPNESGSIRHKCIYCGKEYDHIFLKACEVYILKSVEVDLT
jgi:hypothetical protein